MTVLTAMTVCSGGRRTENLAAPLYQTERISKLQYLKSARANGNAGGLLAATVIMVGWALVLLSGLQLRVSSQLPARCCPPAHHQLPFAHSSRAVGRSGARAG